MRDDLFFIPLIARALRERNPKASMLAAFKRITLLGRDAQHRRGYRQFLRFMGAVAGAEQLPSSDGDGVLGRPPFAGLLVERDGRPMADGGFDQAGGSWALPGCRGGWYRIAFETGRILWEGELSDVDLVWGRAFPGQDLRMAADTEGADVEPSRTIPLSDGECTLCTYPGPSSGMVVIRFRTSGGSS